MRLKKKSSGFTVERVESMPTNFGPHDGYRQPQGCGLYLSRLIMKSKDPVNGLTMRYSQYSLFIHRPCKDRSGTIAYKATEGVAKFVKI